MKKKKSVKEIRNKYSHNDRQDVVRFAEQNPEYTQKILCENFGTMSNIALFGEWRGATYLFNGKAEISYWGS